MHWEINLDPRGFVSVTASGKFNNPGHAAMTEDILNKPFWKSGTNTLFDMRQLDFTDTKLDNIVSAGKNHQFHDERIGKSKIAFLAKKGLAYASLRQYHSLTEGSVEAEIQLFTKPDTALNWLLV